MQRFGAAVTLVGSTLMIAVGEYELTPRDDLWAVSLSGGGCAPGTAARATAKSR